MNTATGADTVIRFLSPELAADKLGWTLGSVLKRREELGLGPFVARRNRKVTGEDVGATKAANARSAKVPSKAAKKAGGRKPGKRRTKAKA